METEKDMQVPWCKDPQGEQTPQQIPTLSLLWGVKNILPSILELRRRLLVVVG